jgi:hypothetical protein
MSRVSEDSEAVADAAEGGVAAAAGLVVVGGGFGMSAVPEAGADEAVGEAAPDDSIVGSVFEEDDAAWLPPQPALVASTPASTATIQKFPDTDSFGVRMARVYDLFAQTGTRVGRLNLQTIGLPTDAAKNAAEKEKP